MGTTVRVYTDGGPDGHSIWVQTLDTKEADPWATFIWDDFIKEMVEVGGLNTSDEHGMVFIPIERIMYLTMMEEDNPI